VLDSRAGPLDRTLGFLFGAARGLILVVIAVLFLNFFMAPDRQPVWIADARSKPWLDTLGSDLLNRLPEDPEAEIMERIQGAAPQPAGGAAAPDTSAAPGEIEEAPAGDNPGIAADDENALEQQIEAPAQ
jgi:membrane protein required for colicin V production